MKVARYFLVGASAAAVDFALFGALLALLGTPHWFAAAATSFVVATAVNYVLSVTVVFSSGVRFARIREVMLVFLASIVGLALNQATSWFAYQVVGWHIRLAKCAATAAAFAWNFLARNSYILREAR